MKRATKSLAVCGFMVVLSTNVDAARVALVVGNDNYQYAPKLRNARNDATAIGRELEAAGFSVMSVLDASRDQMDDALGHFLPRLQKGDEVVFFYSGHGSQPPSLGPYLLPVDIRPTDSRAIERNGQSLERLAEELGQRARFSLIIIDAGRDDPLRGTPSGRSIAPGSALTRIEPPKGTLVIMAASRGQHSLDRLGENDPEPNGLFTRELIKHMRTPGLSAVEMLRRVRSSVETTAASTNRVQRPVLVDESLSAFYFYPAAGTVSAPAPAPGPAPNAPPTTPNLPPYSRGETAPWSPRPELRREVDAWEQAMRDDSRESFETFLRRFPSGRYADRARARIAQYGSASPAGPAPSLPASAASGPASEFTLWARAQSSNARSDYEAYLRQYPNGRYAELAHAALRSAGWPTPSAPPAPALARPADPAEFPWPPPRASAETVMAPALLPEAGLRSLGEVANALEAALRDARYRRWSYAPVPNGFALISQLEQMKPDGTPSPEPARWSTSLPSGAAMTLLQFVKALATAPEGHYRVIVFVVTDQPWQRTGPVPNSSVAEKWLSSGWTRLPEQVRQRDYSPQFVTTVLVYEFRKTTDHSDASFIETGRLPAEEHLERAGIIRALTRIRQLTPPAEPRAAVPPR